MQNYKQLTVWQKSHELTLQIYRATINFPKAEMYGLTSQMRRAAVSIPTNLAEGCGRKGSAEFARFVSIANGSVSELEYLLLLTHDLKYMLVEDYDYLKSVIIEVKSMGIALYKSLLTAKNKT